MASVIWVAVIVIALVPGIVETSEAEEMVD
jgi:hypothetical protein